MTQISRPFQIALVAMGLFVAVWFVALRGHSAGSSASAPSASSSPAKTPTPANPSSAGSVYHGSAPGVEGLTRAITKARGAVAQSQQNAHQLQEGSTKASSTGSPQAAGTASAGGTQAATLAKPHSTAATKEAASKAAGAPSASGSKGSASSDSAASSKDMQATIEGELKRGKVVMILFWNPKSAVDVAVRRELHALGQQLGGKVAVHVARAKQVGSFGSFTRTVHVYGTPTILVVNKHGQTTSLTGLTDVFSLKQAITEAKQAQ